MENPFRDFIRSREAEDKPTYKYLLNPLHEWLSRNDKDSFSPGLVKEYIESSECNLDKNSSKNRLITAVKLWAKHELDRLPMPSDGGYEKYIAREKHLQRFRSIQPYRKNRRSGRKALTMDEVKQLLDTSSYRDRVVNYLYLYLGARPSELLGNGKGGWVEKYERNRSHVRIDIYSTKTESLRSIYGPTRVGDLLEKAVEEEWLNICYDTIRKRLQAYSDAVEIKLTPHVLRHTFQTHMRNELKDPALVAALMGHSIDTIRSMDEVSNVDLDTTDEYDSTFEHEKRRAMIEDHYLKNVQVGG